jgi:hypothetical protein
VRLPGESPGAEREVVEASVLGIPVFRLVGEVALIVSFVAEWHERRAVGS